MSKHVKRNQMMSSVIIVLVMIVTFVATYFGTKASFDQGTVEVKNTITESITTSVRVDTPDGRPHLQDSETGVDVSTRSYEPVSMQETWLTWTVLWYGVYPRRKLPS